MLSLKKPNAQTTFQSVVTRCLYVWLCISLWTTPAHAATTDGGIYSRIAALHVSEGALVVHSRFTVHLPPSLHEALEQGVPLSFRLDFELTQPRTYALWQRVSNWFSPAEHIHYKLTFLPLSQQYRLNSGGLHQNYATLSEALSAIGGIRGWQVLPPKAIEKRPIHSFAGRIRLMLDRSQLPRPFQLNTLNSADWALDSDWIPLTATAPKTETH